ncbi:imelysin family protein [Polaribacter glomeratus]|uniref:Peptidase M75 superfamily protein n=1 Tax=Polaribacter glomeratus TaxID=102 RepID=A0A2S7WWN7_9FLAO|nr:imelysin family protein [Polaribacter glomeratus]PQJ82013.1 peptidase M75 superfamily protein [Polaribacter glomeratus]TXD66606.1 imelysin family protein [Polaribacter glomeratus]
MFRRFLLLFVSIVIISACSSSEETATIATDNFDRSALLVNIADNIIIPAYEDFSNKMSALKTAGEIFTTTPNQTNLNTLRASWFVAYKTWQQIEVFNIGKAEEIQFSFYMNIYPLTVKDVEDNIANGSYDLNSVNNQDAQGFPALDYLLYGVADTDATILEKYTSAANKENYKKYITAVLNQMNTLTASVTKDFKAQRNTFVNNTSNTLTGSVNELINDYIFYFEKRVRAGKFGIPAGIFSSNPLPEKVEGFYKNDISKELSLQALTAVKNLFEGKYYATATTGVSFKAYLIKLNRADIATSISSQFEAAEAEINKLNNSFSIQINLDNTAMTKSYDELQKAVVLLKVDMLQTFNVSVDYVDADGD